MIIENLDEAIHQPARTRIMSYLAVHNSIDFNTLKHEMKMTDGQIATQTKNLESVGYISINKEFVGKKTRTTYTLTSLGRQSFVKYIEKIEFLIKQNFTE